MRVKVLVLGAIAAVGFSLPVNASDSGHWVGWTSSPQDLGNVTLDIDVAMAAPLRPASPAAAPVIAAPAPSSSEVSVAVVPLDTVPVRKPAVRPVRLVSEQVASVPVPVLLHPERLWTIGSFR